MNIEHELTRHGSKVEDEVSRAASSPDFMAPLENNFYNRMRVMIDDSITTDIVDVDTDELYNFAQYWKEFRGKDDEIVKGMKIPGDIIMEGTVPITDMVIRARLGDGGLHELSDVRVVIFEEALANISELVKNDVYDVTSVAVGGVVISELQIIFPLMLSNGKINEIMICSAVSSLKINRSQYNKYYELMNHDFKSILLTVIGMIVPAWYGMQLALLHPATETIFANPIKEKRDRKEQLKPVMVNGIPKKVKYVRKHIIKKENSIYQTLDNSMEQMCQIDETLDKRTYKRHSYLWRVLGHPRILQSGKTTWVKAHWRGPLKDFAKVVKTKINDRDIDIVKEDGNG